MSIAVPSIPSDLDVKGSVSLGKDIVEHLKKFVNVPEPKKGKWLIFSVQLSQRSATLNPNGWTDQDEIWHGGGPRGGKVLGGVSTRYPHPPGTGCLWSLNRAFWRKLYKTKVAGHP